MRNRVPKKALFAAAGAALLSGSVFAAGPTVDGIPTVVISDQMDKASVDADPANPYDWHTDSTRNVYRYIDALNLADYVNYQDNSQASLEQVHYIFQEWEDDGGGNLTPVADGSQTIQINGEVGDQSLPSPATKGDFDFANDPNVWAAGAIDFNNLYRTGPDPDNPTNPSGISGPFTDNAYISLYVASQAAADVDVDVFRVITTNEAQFDPATGAMARYDFLSGGGGSILTCELVMDDLSHWTWAYGGLTGSDGAILGDFFKNPQGGYDGAYSASKDLPGHPGVTREAFAEGLGGTWSAAGSDFLTLQSDATAADTVVVGTSAFAPLLSPQFGGWQSYRVDAPSTYANAVPAANVMAGRVYVARFEVSATTPASVPTRMPDYRFRLGDTGTNGVGNTSDEYTDFSANHLTADARQHRTYFYAHVDGDGYGEGYNPRNLTAVFDVLDFYNAAFNDTNVVQLDKVDVLSFDRADLGEGTVVLNEGGAAGTDFTLAAGQMAPPPGGADFGAYWQSQDINDGFGFGGIRPVAFSGGAKALEINYEGGPALTVASWSPSGVPASTGSEIIDNVPNGSLVALDVWLSSTDGATANNKLAQTRISLQAQAYGETGDPGATPAVLQGRAALFSFNADNNNVDPAYGNGEENGLLAPDPLKLETGAKRYTVMIEPQVATGSTIDLRPIIEVILYDGLEFAADFGAWPPVGTGVWVGRESAGNLTINHVTATVYTAPDGIADAVCD